VSLFIAGSRTDSGNDAKELHPRREDKTAHLCERIADAVLGLLRETR
jgi:hypothetical protein